MRISDWSSDVCSSDLFMLHALVDYPDRATTLRIMALNRREAIAAEELPAPASKLSQEAVFRARQQILGLTLVDAVAEYIAALVDATRRPAPYSAKLAEWLRWGDRKSTRLNSSH